MTNWVMKQQTRPKNKNEKEALIYSSGWENVRDWERFKDTKQMKPVDENLLGAGDGGRRVEDDFHMSAC